MAKNTQLTNLAANAETNAVCALANSGYIRIYDGVQPATGDTAVGAQVPLAELQFGATAFGAAVAGVATANAITPDASANNTGTASWFRVLKSDGITALWDGSVGTATSNLILNSVAIQSGAEVSITAFTFTAQKATTGY